MDERTRPRTIRRLHASRRTLIATAVGAAILAALFGAGPGVAMAAATDDDAIESAQIVTDALAATALTAELQPPAAWAIASRGGENSQPIQSGGVGGADYDTRFLLGSLSKPMTAAVIMRFVDRGELRLDAPVREVLSQFRPQDETPITIAQLLTHTSGFDTAAGLDAVRDPSLTIAERVAGANTTSRGEASYRYSNLNYAVLGAVLEEVSGLPFAEVVKRELFEPLGMGHSTASVEEAQAVAAGGHRLAFGIPVSISEAVPAGGAPDGYMVSSANDVAIFLRMLLRDGNVDHDVRFLSEQSVRSIVRSHVSTSDAPAPGASGYGLGWATGGSEMSPFAAHVGRTSGFFAHARMDFAAGVGAVVLQSANAPFYDQTAPLQQLLAAATGSENGVNHPVSGEPGAVTALFFAAMGVGAFTAAFLVSWWRRRRDRLHPPANPAGARQRAFRRVVIDAGGVSLIVVSWQLIAGAMLTGAPSWQVDPFALSVELTLIAGGVAALLIARAVSNSIRLSRVPRAPEVYPISVLKEST